MTHAKSNILPTIREVTEPLLAFHPDRPQDADVHPLRGLRQFGPYSRSHNFKLRDPLVMAVICPTGEFGKVMKLAQEFNATHQPRERKQYLQTYDGFSRLFG